VEERCPRAERPDPVADRAPEDAPQDVAAVLVAGLDAVGDGHHRRAQVVGHATHEVRLGLLARHVRRAERLRRRLHDGHHGARVERRHVALDDREHALEPRARVHVLPPERPEVVHPLPIELREHEVPELEEAVRVELRHALPGQRQLGRAVVVHLRARAARAVRAVLRRVRGPEVVLRVEAQDALRRDPVAAPLGERRVIVGEDRHHDAIARQLQDAERELDGPGDRLLLEVVVEGEVAEHLEEREVPERASHVVDVARADALLDRRRPLERVRALAEEHVLELVHPRAREEQGGVVRRDQGGARIGRVPAGDEEVLPRGAEGLGGGRGRVRGHRAGS
jgi:hypothetical protein